ncbi:MAG TPA: glycosyltransferase [Nevskia sp.]|nr:glycosyltransferase [Nevskia sp.]
MKVLHVSHADVRGGAPRAAHRIHQGLRKSGIDSHMLVLKKYGDDPTVHINASPLTRIRAGVFNKIERSLVALQKDGNPVYHSLGLFGSGLVKWIEDFDPDVVNLHWVNSGTLSIREIGTLRVPVIWTLHDMWAFSGCAHYDDPKSELRWQQGFTRTNRPGSLRGIDLDRLVYSLKQRAWRRAAISVVTPSRWMGECARGSRLFAGRPCRVIANGVDTALYTPARRDEARRLWGIAPDQKVLLFGAMLSTADPRKGFHLLTRALELGAEALRELDCGLLVFGAPEGSVPTEIHGLPVRCIGVVNDEERLASAYAAADVLAAPSMQENLPNTVVEAMASGTPSVAFDIGGLRDLIEHRVNGYLAAPFDPADLARGITELLSQDTAPLRERARSFALDRLDDRIAAHAYADFYAEALRRSANPTGSAAA